MKLLLCMSFNEEAQDPWAIYKDAGGKRYFGPYDSLRNKSGV